MIDWVANKINIYSPLHVRFQTTWSKFEHYCTTRAFSSNFKTFDGWMELNRNGLIRPIIVNICMFHGFAPFS
jgi:hypothetical protein